jgi:hypothetical protein
MDEDQTDAYEERAAILEYDAGLGRVQAEAAARRMITVAAKSVAKAKAAAPPKSIVDVEF